MTASEAEGTAAPPTPAQKLAHETWLRTGSVKGAARELGKSPSTIREHLRRLGIEPGQAPPPLGALRQAPERFGVTGTTTLVGGDGSVKVQWIKIQKKQEEQLKSLEKALERLTAPFLGAGGVTKAPKHLNEDLMCVIPLGDPHVGMLASAAETGEEFNLQLAEDLLVRAVDRVVDLAPAAHRCLLINLGDYFHTDNQTNRTNAHGHQLDVAGRWTEIVEVGLRIQRRMIERCLERFGSVHVDNVRGNHDEHTAFMLSQVMAAYFNEDPRVTVEKSPALHHFFEFGNNLIGTHHGHTTRTERLGLVMANDRPQAWGRTKHRRFYVGHRHSDSLRDEGGVIIEGINTLAPRDAYASGGGYRSGRDIKLDIWHRRHGLINRHIVGVEQLREAA